MAANKEDVIKKTTSFNDTVEHASTTQVSIKDEAEKKNAKESQNFKRANTAIGQMNKFILQLSRVERAYREIESAFMAISNDEIARTVQKRMKRKGKLSHMSAILSRLGFGSDTFSDDEIKDIFASHKDINSGITFQRVLIGVGVSYFAKLDKEAKANKAAETEYSGTDPSKPKTDVIIPDDEDGDDSKQSEESRRFAVVGAGFAVVKKMFDCIDTDGSGEISLKEFEESFNDICRDPEIVKQRMKELDYNDDQSITFREFIFGISSWCGFNDEMMVDENDDDLDKDIPPTPTNKANPQTANK